jgi:hypothetical protein
MRIMFRMLKSNLNLVISRSEATRNPLSLGSVTNFNHY